MKYNNSIMNTPKNTIIQTAARQIWPVLAPLYNIRHIVFGVLFLAYVQFLHPVLLGLLASARQKELSAWGLALGLVLFGIQAWELIGVWLKLPVTQEKIRQNPNPSGIAKFGVGAAQLAHLFMALMIFNNILPFFGMTRICFNYDTRFAPCFFSTLGFLVILVKEMIVLFLFLNSKPAHPPLDLNEPAVRIREMVGEVILLSFGMVAFSLSWNGIIDFLNPAEGEAFWVTLLGSILLFMTLYPPSRLVFITEEWLVRQPRLARIINLAFFAAALLASLSEVPGLFQ
jgi:hypothetical protein